MNTAPYARRILPTLVATAVLTPQLLHAEDTDDGFVSLFDGRSLAGWIGETDSYRVAEGLLSCKPGGAGKLYTEDEFADFEFRFEFRLTPGANNGIALRAPGAGDPAYVAIECQVLDNTAAKYAGLKPYQYHGSLYGVAAAERGALRPVGEWNRQSILCRGNRVSVTLNDQKILDVDLTAAAPGGKTIDGRPHPGLFRKSGRLGLLGHGAAVDFRNLQVRRLSPASASRLAD